MINTPTILPHHARGAVLLVSLVILLVLTLLGVTALKGTVLEERMAGNLRDQHLAFQAAEAALRAGEQFAIDNLATLEGAVAIADPQNWDGTNATSSLTLDTAQLALQPVFHVGPPQMGARVGVTLPPCFRRMYPVTARGVGGSDTAVVVLRSMVETADHACS